jgi:hypothetical protein
MNKAVGLFIPDKAHKKIYLHTSTKCVRSSEIFRTSYPVFSIVVFRKYDQCRTKNQRHVSLLMSNRERNDQVGQFPKLMECQTELGPGKPSSSVFLKDQEEHSMQADWFWT